MKATSKQQSCCNFSWLILIHVFSIFLALFLSYVAAAHKVFPHWSQKNNTTSLFIITFHCCTIRGSNQLAFRVRRAATRPFTSMDQHYHNTIMLSKIYLMMRIKGDVSFQRQDISTQHSIPRNDRLQKARKNIPF